MNEIVVELSGADAPVVGRRGLGEVLRSARWVLSLCALGLAFVYAVLKGGARDAADSYTALVAIGAAAVVYWIRAREEERAPAFDPFLLSLVVLVPGYVLLQLIPLPSPILRGLSPGRAHLADLVDAFADTRFAPLSINPSATLTGLTSVVGCAVAFLLVRDLASRTRKQCPWAVLLPIAVVGIVEAIVGLTQAAMRIDVRGTFASAAPFAGLLEAALPLTIAGGIAWAIRPSTRRSMVFVRPWAAVLTWCVAIVLLGAIVQSGSRMGLVAALCGVLAMGVVAMTTRLERRARVATLAGLLAACAVIGTALPVDRIFGRFATAADPSAASKVLPVWRDSLRLVAEYPLTGTGLGTFESAFAKYQTTSRDTTVSFAGNDYLQLLAELGLVGAPLFAALLFTAHRRSARAAVATSEWHVRLLHRGCMGAITAVGVHSVLDFNTHVAANVFMLAWLAGFAVSAPNSATPSTVHRRWVLAPAFALLLLAAIAGFRGSATVSQALCRIGVCSQSLMAAGTRQDAIADAGHAPTSIEALVGNPASAAAWCDLGDEMLAAGRAGDARTAFVNAVALAPNKPGVHQRAANFYFGLGELQTGLVHASTALQQTPRAQADVFQMYLQRQVPIDAVLAHGLPAGPHGVRAYLRAVIAADRASDAAVAWQFAASHGYADDPLARDYVHFLFARRAYARAAEIWGGHVGDRAARYLRSSFVFNGGFESAPSGAEFDWQLNSLDNRVVVSLDSAVARSGGQSLRIQFSGADVDYHDTRQVVFVAPGVYQFSAMVRAMIVPPDEGLAFHIFDADAHQIDAWTGAVTGTRGWTLLQQTVTVPDKAGLLTVEIARVKGQQEFDTTRSHIAGTLWIDNVALTKIDSQGSGSTAPAK